MTVRGAVLGVAMALLAVAGCSSGQARAGAPQSSASGSVGAHGWSRHRFLAAFDKRRGKTRTASPTTGNDLVGAVFTHDTGGDHFCTASVVDSAGRNLIVTAAHCVWDPHSGQRSDLVFVPGYRSGDAPNGVWPLGTITVDPSWAADGNPDLDVAFAIVQPQGGRQVQQVLGANKLGIDRGYQQRVRLTGYPSSGDVPITCMNLTSEQSPTQLRIDCPDYTGGTSGSPWITGFDPSTRTGTVIGVIGGYQEGGNSADTSYSSYFGDAVQALYNHATS
jgi:V8-like Glu-specific endopeptidase